MQSKGPEVGPQVGAIAGEMAVQQDPKLEAVSGEAQWPGTGFHSPQSIVSSMCSSRSSNSAASTWTTQPATTSQVTFGGTSEEGAFSRSTSSSEVGEHAPNASKTSDLAARRPPTLTDLSMDANWSTLSSPGMKERRCSRRMWQPDSETEKCSLQTCDILFVSSIFSVPSPGGGLVSRRHHCRQCGRVVCGSCSKGQKSLLDEDCTPGSASMARVCDACMQGSETFNYQKGNNFRVTLDKKTILRRLMRTGKESPDSSVDQARLATSESNPDLGQLEAVMRRNASSMPSLATFFANAKRVGNMSPNVASSPSMSPKDQCKDKELKQPSPLRDDQSAFDKPMSDYTVPGLEADAGKGGANGSPPKAAAAPAEEAKDERQLQLEKELAASSYYQGLLRHEPAALKALTGALMSSTGN